MGEQVGRAVGGSCLQKGWAQDEGLSGSDAHFGRNGSGTQERDELSGLKRRQARAGSLC